MKENGEVDLAWISGFFDGEGSIIIQRDFYSRRSIHHFLRVTVGNTHRASLEIFRKRFGGTIRPQWRAKKHFTQSYEWVISHRQAGRFLIAVHPHLVTKRKEAQLALDFDSLKEITSQSGGNNHLPMEIIAQRDAYYWGLKEAKTAYHSRIEGRRGTE